MSSINLLPQNYIKKKKETMAESQNKLPMLLSFLMISLVIFGMAFLYVENRSRRERVDLIKKETVRIDLELEKTVGGNELLVLENKAKFAASILSDQMYFSEVFYYLQERLIENVYAKTIKVEVGGADVADVEVDAEFAAKDYLSISDQLYIFKTDPSVEKVSLAGMNEDEDGSISFSLNISMKKSIVQKNDQKDQVEKTAE